MTPGLVRVKRRVELYLIDLILLGCVADPIIYAARMRQVRSGYSRAWNYLVRRVACRGVQTMSSVHGGRSSSNEARSVDRQELFAVERGKVVESGDLS